MDYDVCIYHHNCPDGFGAAWAVRHALGDTLRFVPGISRAAVDPEDWRDLSILLVDYCWNRETIEAVASIARHITVIDHHDSAQRQLHGLRLGNLVTYFDMKHSGAVLAWNFFNPEPAPALLRHIEDYDLFRLALPGTNELNLALTSLPYDFALWDTLDVEQLKSEGAAILRWMTQQIDHLAASASRATLAGFDVPCCNAPRCFVDRLGHHLAKNEAFAIVWAETADAIQFSLRSRDDGEIVNRIAEEFGGRGHRHAAVFSLPQTSETAAKILGRESRR
jgi:oligoribonuclease NrnB/cAMP/cGMP phosphodiesterase (DHH superfamily)